VHTLRVHDLLRVGAVRLDNRRPVPARGALPLALPEPRHTTSRRDVGSAG